ncbi:hypothetical protein [Brevibacillus migulae]|uniref:hypothetical protein n=1 Tax=Brevibacillus migulae TaxID=1644114 RepID=UPI00106E99D5|nr:hypothetical protein [Brevibacillus migulae]
MDTIFWFIVIPIVIITVYFFLKFKRKNETANNIQINYQHSPTYDLPWEIKSYKSTELELYNPPKALALTDSLKSHINNVIKLSPNAKDIVQNERKVVVKFGEEVLNKLKSGEFKLMRKEGTLDEFRAIAVDQKNQIRNHGWIEMKDVWKVNPTQLANAALGVLTVITSQEHLERINKQLNVIDRKIDTLLRLYNNDKIGKIQGSIRYLKSILPDVGDMDGSSMQVYSAKMEDISLRCYDEMHSILLEFPQLINEALHINEKTKFGIDKVVNEIKELTYTFEQKLLIAFGNIEVMSICLKINNDFGKNSEVSLNRLTDIEDYYKELLAFHDKFNSILKDKNLGLDAIFRTSKTVSNKKAEIEKHLTYHNENISSNRSVVDQHIVQLKNGSDTLLDGPIDLQVDYDEEDNITAVYRLEKAN